MGYPDRMDMQIFLNRPWAIMPRTLEALCAMARAGGLEGFTGAPPAPRRVGDVAVIELDGVIMKDAPKFPWFEVASTRLAGEQLRAELDDPGVSKIVLVIDSPGGTVDGTQELARQIYGARSKKPIIAFADGLMASAAYYIGSAAEKVYLSGDNTITGSIGVVTSHVDYSGLEQRLGVKTTEIYAGKYKRIASNVQPLSEEGRDYLQAQVDQMYSTIVDDVAMFRGVSPETVLKKMADGRVFVGRQGIEAGLADGVATLDELTGERSSPTKGGAMSDIESRCRAVWETNAGGVRAQFLSLAGFVSHERRVAQSLETGSYLAAAPPHDVESRCRAAWETNAGGCRDEFMSLEGYIAYERRHGRDARHS